MIVVDSSVWIDYFNGVINWQTNSLEKTLGEKQIIITDHILLEVLRGFRSDSVYKEIKIRLKKFPCFNTLNNDSAIICAENYRYLRSMGITLRSTIDLIIGTFCIENNLPLLHNDKDFNPIEKHLGLEVIK